MTTTFFVLEGPDGAGKTRHARDLCGALVGAGLGVEWFQHQPPRFPSDDPWTVALHRAVARDRMRPVHLWRRSAASVVVCDRWWHSTAVVSDVADRADESLALLSLVTGEEHMWRGVSITTVVLTAPDKVLDARLEARGTPATDYDRTLRRAYESCVYTRDLERVDTSGPPKAVTAQLVELVRGVLPEVSHG